jgi:hypothetical protein
MRINHNCNTHYGRTVATVFPKKITPGGLLVGDDLPRADAVAVDIYTVVSDTQLINASVPILITEFGIIIDGNNEHPRNASLLILLTKPKLTLVSGQPRNAKAPIIITEFGIIIDDNLHPLNIEAPIVVMELPNETVDNKIHPLNISVPRFVIGELSNVTDDILEQFKNAPGPTLVTVLGIVIEDVMPLQPLKAS